MKLTSSIFMAEYTYPEVGVFFEDRSATFVVWAPERQLVELILGEQVHLMNRDERGYWRTTIEGVLPGTRYLYRLDNKKTLPDPASVSQPEGVHGPSEAISKTYAWSDSSWTGLPLSEMIIYELHAGTFTSAGTFEGVISKLPYLKDLGVNTIELMPLAQFPGKRNWGYDGVYPFAVQQSYGGAAGLKQLVDEAHRHQIAVILDVVYNHLGPEGNYLEEYGPYFTDRYKTFWGKAINFDDAHCDGVRNFYWQNALMWLNEFHIDGLRLDAVHAIWDFSARHFIEELRAKVSTLATQSGKQKILIAELDLNNPRYINPPSKSGFGLDGQWTDEFHHALHAVVTGETNGYYEDFGEVTHLAKVFRDSYVYTGQYSPHRKKHFGTLPVDTAYHQFVVFAQNHDQVGNRLLGDRLTSQLSLEELKLTAATYLLSPHVPMLFMGEEYGEKNPFQYFISHSDKALVEIVREGRKKEFSYFGWKDEVPDPQDEKTFKQCILSWKPDETLLGYYKFLIAFRKNRKAMQNKERNSLIVLPSPDKLLSFERIFGQDQLLIILNFNKGQSMWKQPLPNTIRKIFDSSSKQWNGPGEVCPESLHAGESFSVNALSAMIFEVNI
jgi:maltooligosyltrehalose trehalohydrolase